LHRLLKEFTQYFAELGRTAIRSWDRFFFTPADPIIVGLLRITLGALLLWDIGVLGLDLRDYLGSDGWISPAAARGYLAENAPGAWSLWLYVPDRWLSVAWAVCLVVVALFMAGFASRWTAVLAWAVALSTVRRAPATLYGFDYMITTWTFYVAVFGASGQALSVDRLLRARRSRATEPSPVRSLVKPAGTISANLTIRMIQLHLCLIYGSAGLSKLMAPEWWNGTAMEMIILTPEFRRFNLVWLTAYPLVLNLATHCGLLLEIMFPVLIWVRKLRPIVLVSAVSLHLGIDLILGLTEFGLTMIAANLVWVSGSWLRQIAARSGPAQAHRSTVIELTRDRHTEKNRKSRASLEKSGTWN
jgi:hypothetical protein